MVSEPYKKQRAFWTKEMEAHAKVIKRRREKCEKGLEEHLRLYEYAEAHLAQFTAPASLPGLDTDTEGGD